MTSYKYEALEMREVYSVADCKTSTDRFAFKCAIESGKPVSVGEVVAIPPNWIPPSERQAR